MNLTFTRERKNYCIYSLTTSQKIGNGRVPMNRMNYSLSKGLTPHQISTMHQKTLEIVQEVGIEVPHKEILKFLSQYNGIKIEKPRVKFADWLVDKYATNHSYPTEEFSQGYTIVSGAYEQNVLDMDTGEIRVATLRDLVELTKLADSYGTVGSAPVRPVDLPTPLQEIAMYKVSWQNSSKRAKGIFDANPKSSVDIAKYICEMAQVAGKSFSVGIWINSPFQTFSNELETLYHFLDKGVPLWVATMPIAGATAPIFMVGAYI